MFLKKLSYLAKHLRLWNREHFGNQESWLLIVTNRIVENKQAESILTAEESSVLAEIIREKWVVSKHTESICVQSQDKTGAN